MLSRRDLFAGAASLGLSAAVGTVFANEKTVRRFGFAHLTDLHIQPELGAPDGVAMAVRKLLSLHPRPDFVLTGGDHVMDLLKVTRERADLQFRLLEEALKPLEMPVYSAVGNHDVYGWSTASPATESDPLYGKRMFEERFAKAPLHRSFDHNGWHFVILDTIQPRNRDWMLAIDDAQLTWLKDDLEKAGRAPTVVMSHGPILTAFMQYTASTGAPTPDTLITHNGREVHEILAKHNVKAVLQGHTHVLEEIDYLGIKYITAGAVCGDWWKGPRLGVHPEGFTVCDVDGDRFSWRYVPYGWKART
ncbi:metallophosphoesterase family protein [Fimbriimonas ginsengisoli]|uniref:Metallophosphoesterase n=1 Tax=Fimbriimonas ginsengisoli Gsoil 348 TaxID=661478 RepID=A0A068NVZ0_FIMGI|nr:metallophosphoesterase [Fimbriimonas ginsengisoli]AIE87522.1 metallophosphoesterase [Fimbriimonas ginsengisoli Gsoil 348]